ncbi:hypothetical protein Pst134EA_021090 [Puccinia striiformis f. sp. tritici]|uniref:Uncharacterized protein n=1 Tax=Puccinia striiformis f. sp. tritici PST-78 TaxID=1165861 RepID=A0A0L0VCE0_9BASI|nr:hypothetical protein Pst134EA_021090 [Puccinia striiformis f. sp. tritici]KAH9457207.1 hypothetical protein Pst134EA_021090 [Puccinia striiformis f. sp. tritici]KAI9614879.1 hypothetical protein H4Q26_009277 [Puccinia striiformis f. sp. tritici PST-130]KNE96639.1 hypothetical protein PSTG_10046 [Puccinia striiformis f. sp. tritici PST-78]
MDDVTVHDQQQQQQQQPGDESARLTMIHQRFRWLHEHVRNSEKFVGTVGSAVLDKYVEDLEELINTLSTKVDGRISTDAEEFKWIWAQFLNGQSPFRKLLMDCDLGWEARLEEELSRLAFLLQHPTLPLDLQITHDTRVIALDEGILSAQSMIRSESHYQRKTKILIKGYDHEYLGTEQILDPILEDLKNFASEFSPETHLAPYTTLIAPSMAGKTRLLMELSKHVCVVYICLRPRHYSTKYPWRSNYASDVLLDYSYTSTQKQYERLVVAILDAVADFFSAQQTGTKQDKLNRWIAHSFPKKNPHIVPTFWTVVRAKMEDSARSAESMEHNLGRALQRMKDSTNFIDQKNLRVLLAIDEARELLHFSYEARGLLEFSYRTDISFFDKFRRALKKIPESTGFFSILADSLSRLSDFNPTAHGEPSNRIENDNEAKLFPPIYALSTFDVNAGPDDPPTRWQELQSPLRLFCYGYPSWRLYADDAKQAGLRNGEIVRNLTTIALQKLLDTHDLELPAASLTESQAIALLGPTIQPQLWGASHLNAELVSNHGAACMYIDSSRGMIISGYPSQITFASSANQYLGSDEARLIRCVRVLASLSRQGFFSPGDVQDLVSRIILLRAMQVTMGKVRRVENASADWDQQTMPFGHSVRLTDFLQTLTGLDAKKLLLGSTKSEKKKRLLEEGQLFWNHFISIEYTPTSEKLMRELYRGVAVHCKPDQPGFDQLFPIYLQSDPTAALDEKNITFSGIHVKDPKEDDDLAKYSHYWTPDDAEIELEEPNPYLVLYFSLRDEREESQHIRSTRSGRRIPKPKIITIPDGVLSKEESRRRISFAFYGLDSFPFLSQDLIGSLEDLLAAHPNFSFNRYASQ